jgi:deazaflavin-dependent oxidoreductase (nitroreductase family)
MPLPVLLNPRDARTVPTMREHTLSTTQAATRDESHLPVAIRILRKFNPTLVRMLQSRLHGMFSRDLLVLHYVGAKTGTRRALPLSYAEIDGQLYLCSRDSLWWRNLRNGRPVEIDFRGRRLTATPAVLDLQTDEALAGFRAFLTKYPKTGEMLYDVRADKRRRPLEEDLRREVLRSVVVRLDYTSSAKTAN